LVEPGLDGRTMKAFTASKIDDDDDDDDNTISLFLSVYV
jgi:hypothetical protein